MSDRYGAEAEDQPWSVRHPATSVSLAILVVASALFVLWDQQVNDLVMALCVGAGLVLVAVWSGGVNYLGGLADGRFVESYEQAHSAQETAT